MVEAGLPINLEWSLALNIIVALLYVVLGFVFAKLIVKYITRSLKNKVPHYALMFINKIVFYIVIFVSIIFALITIGAERYITGVIVAGGVLGVVLGFASEKAVSNFISGVFLLLDRPFSVGDPVEIKNEAGIVTGISFLSTKIRTWDGRYARFPNSEVFGSTIINYGKHVARRIDLTVGVAYKEDPDKVLNVIKEVIDEHPLILAEPEPTIFVDSLGESSVNIAVKVWVPTTMWFDVRKQIVSIIKKKLEEEKIEIPFPQMVIWFKTPLELK